MRKSLLLCSLLACAGAISAQTEYKGYTLVWNDEFETPGTPNPDIWGYETGFQRNHEDQWYQADNAYVEDGKLVIEGRREKFANPWYQAGSSDWRRSRENVEYTSACVTTKESISWLYGRFEICARIPAYVGCWPAIWLLGTQDSWPQCGEIDIMEYYQINGKAHILANTAWGSATSQYNPTWNTQRYPVDDFIANDPDWANKFHVWRMDWDENYIKIYIDGKLLNITPLEGTYNAQADYYPYVGVNPFRRPQYLLLNLALGGDNGGSLSSTPFPCKYEIDYVRVYEKNASGLENVEADAPSINVVGDTVTVTSSQQPIAIDVYNLAGSQLRRLPQATFHNFALLPGAYILQCSSATATTSYKVVVA